MEKRRSQFQFYLNFRARQSEAGHVCNSPCTGIAVHLEVFDGRPEQGPLTPSNDSTGYSLPPLRIFTISLLSTELFCQDIYYLARCKFMFAYRQPPQCPRGLSHVLCLDVSHNLCDQLAMATHMTWHKT